MIDGERLVGYLSLTDVFHVAALSGPDGELTVPVVRHPQHAASQTTGLKGSRP